MTDHADELAALRRLLDEALSDVLEVSEGASELRRQFSEAAMRRLDVAADMKAELRKQDEDERGDA